MSKPAPTRYRTLNWSSYNASLRERGSLTVWFDPSIAWHAAPSGKRGRQQTFSDAAIQACLRCWQTNANQSTQGQNDCPLCRAETAPLCESGGAVCLEMDS